MNRKQYGTYAEYLTVTKLISYGYDVFVPIGDNSKVDLICIVGNTQLRFK